LDIQIPRHEKAKFRASFELLVLIAEHPRMVQERRGQPRSNLRAPLLLLAQGWSVPTRTETQNLSKEGFFCHTRQAFAPGERLKFLLLLPAVTAVSECAKGTGLQGTAEVIRVLAGAADGDFSIACRLSGYSVATNIDFESKEMSAILSEPGQFEAWLNRER
jgi:hypothetical protein